MLITLYVLNYNYKQFLSECLSSVLSQSDRNFEIILVDNGSNDGSAQILSELARKSNWPFLQFDNKSLGSVGNHIMSICNGRYVVRLDADDYLAPDFIEKMREKIIIEAPDIVFANYYYIDGSSRIYGSHKCLPRGRGEDGYHDEPVHGACTLINVERFREQGGYDEDLPCQDGFDLYMKMRSSFISLVDHYSFYYRRGHKSLSSHKQKLFDTRNIIIERQFSREGRILPRICNLLLCPSFMATPSSEARDRVITFTQSLLKLSPVSNTILVLGREDKAVNWPRLAGVDYWRWEEKEALSISSMHLVERIAEYYQSEHTCTINLAEQVAGPAYISAAPKYASLMETDGTITGTRFDSSLFRPVVGGVSQVSCENVTRDIDRWVVHTGGITCRKITDKASHPVLSLLEVETSALEYLLDV